MTADDVSALMRGLMPSLTEFIRKTVDTKIDERLRALSEHNGAMAPLPSSVSCSDDTLRDAKPKIRHRGSWEGARWFSRGDGVLHKGCAYRCRSGNSNVEPGTDGSETEWERLA